MGELKQKTNVLIFTNKQEYFLTKEEYFDFKYNCKSLNNQKNVIGDSFLEIISNYNVIQILNDHIELLQKKDINHSTFTTFLEKLRDGLKVLNSKFIDIIMFDIQNNYNKLKDKNTKTLNTFLQSLLDSYVCYIKDSKELIDSYYNILNSKDKKNKKKNALKTETFKFQDSKAFTIQIPRCEKILCFTNYKKIIPSTYISTQNFLKHNNSDEKNKLKYNMKNKEYYYSTAYQIEYFKDFISVSLNYFLENNILIKKCENCGKYFTPFSRVSEKFCQHIYKHRQNM